MINENVTHLIVISIILSSFAFIPILIDTIYKKDMIYIPYSTLMMLLTANCISLSIAIYIKAWAYTFPYIVSFITIIMLLYYKQLYKKDENTGHIEDTKNMEYLKNIPYTEDMDDTGDTEDMEDTEDTEDMEDTGDK